MRLTSYLLWLVVLLPGGAEGAASAGSAALGRPGRPLAEWAEKEGLQWGWTKPNTELWATNRWARFQFTVDSRRVQCNGIAVWLSEPVVRTNGQAYLAALDLEKTLKPLLHAPRMSPGRKIRTICLDPGHGGRDPGNQAGKQQEKKYALLLAREVMGMLQAAGLKVYLTRSSDTFVDLARRPELAKRRGADLLVSLHLNSVANQPSVGGAEVYCLTPAGASSTNVGGEVAASGALPGNQHNDQSLLFAYQVQKALVQGLGLEDRGVRRARFAVLRTAQMPAILVEAAFMSNPEELKRIMNPKLRKPTARAIADGLLAGKRLLERGTVAPARSR